MREAMTAPGAQPDLPGERHYSPGEIAEQWGVSPEWVRRRFKHEPGVVRLGKSWRVSASAVRRVYQQSQVAVTALRLPKTRARRRPDGTVAIEPRVRNGVR